MIDGTCMYFHGGLPIEVNVDVPNATTVAAMEEAERLLMEKDSKGMTYDEYIREMNS